MEAAKWNQIQDLFEELLAMDEEARVRTLTSECKGDEQMRGTLESMLESAEVDDDFLDTPLDLAGGNALPEVIDDFQIIEEVGRGGMGVVYRARQVSLRRDVAIKVLPHSWCQSKRTVDRFHLEARTLARLHHPGIVTIFADGIADDIHYFAMEFIDGPNLAQLIRARRAPANSDDSPYIKRLAGDLDQPVRLAGMIAGAAEALQLVHDAKIVHRDIKPSNLFVTADGQLKVGDFGLVLDDRDGALSQTGEFGGSPFYMSPEQARGDAESIDARTDVYSLGVVLYELLTQTRPFVGTNAIEIMRNVVEADPPSVRSVAKNAPRDLAIICEVAMAKDPDHRYASAGEMALDLRRAIALQPIHARPLPRRTRALRWVRRHRGAITAGSLALLLSGVVATVLLRLERRRLMAAVNVQWTILVPMDMQGPETKLTFSVRELDPATTTAGPAKVLGHSAHRVSTPPGQYLLKVEAEGHPPMEFMRTVEEGQTFKPITLDSQRGEAQRKDMVFIEPVPVTYPRPLPGYPPMFGEELSIAPYWIDQYEVSNGEFVEFVRLYPEHEPLIWNLEVYDETWDDLPVAGVTVEAAAAYAEWRGKRLPTLAELMYAGRGPEGRLYPWTDEVEITELRGNIGAPRRLFEFVDDMPSKVREDYLAHANRVRSNSDAASSFDVHNLFGNVAELTCSLETTRNSDGSLRTSFDSSFVTGGDWFAISFRHTLASSQTVQKHGRKNLNQSVGFRCAVSAE